MLTLSRVPPIISGSTLSDSAIGRLTDFKRRPLWPVIPALRRRLQAGEALATPLYISLGFSLDEIAAVSKLVGFFATVTGAMIGGVVTARFGARHAPAVRVAPVRPQPVLCAAGCRRASARLSCAVCHCRKHNGRNRRVRLGGLSLRSVLARLHRDSVRAASSLASVGRTLVASS